jgi:MoaA/NifB/PqqE/SkfB family radical SAM enzyme
MRRLPITKRIDANLGYECNNNCLFCYFRDRKQSRRNISTQKAKNLFALIRKLGIDTLEITGGEVTIREDIIELIKYAKEYLKFGKISVITNGARFCEKEFAQDAISAGVDDVLVSIHGHNATLHDRLTDRIGAFDEACRSVKNVLKLGVSCRTNTVVTQLNYTRLSDIAKVVYELGVRKVNYLFFSPLDDACKTAQDLWLKYSDAAPFTKETIDRYKNKFEAISIKIIPFCFLEGYEDYITDLFQNLYNPYEWEYYQRVRIRRNRLIRDIAALIGTIAFMDVRRMASIGMYKSLREAIMRVEAFRHCQKPRRCKKCKFDLICPGVWKEYAKKFGLDEISPVKGKKVTEVDRYLHKRFSDHYNL